VVGEKEHFSWKKKRVSLVAKNVWITERFFDNHYKVSDVPMAHDKKIGRRTDFDVRYRSLLQKAVRRGNADLVYTTGALIESLGHKEKSWFTAHAAIVTFEECWPLGAQLAFNKRFHSKVAALIKVAGSTKARDASGLGFLAYALWEGDQSVLNDSADDKHVKILANAIERPKDFWKWVDSQINSDHQKNLIRNAIKYRNTGSPKDRAVLQAAAYLSVTVGLPEIKPVVPDTQKFPYWIAFDRHTPEGLLALRDIARDLHMSVKQLEWTCFYFEGAQANADLPSSWWERQCRWHFQKIGLAMEEAHLLWEPTRPQIIQALADDSRRLQNDLYKWKISNIERVESLKKQVEIFTEHIDEVKGGQQDLF
jgi:hypothetical protein